jgi:hypothetical protein
MHMADEKKSHYGKCFPVPEAEISFIQTKPIFQSPQLP